MNLTPFNAPTYFPPAYFGVGGEQVGGITDPVLGLTPYYAPTYFPPAYFGGRTSAASPPLPLPGRTHYNPPAYFASTYFYGSAVGGPAIVVAARAPEGRDGGAYSALLTALEEVHEFASVRFGDPARRATGADTSPRAVVIPQGWEESDEADPTLLVRRASFVVRLSIRVTDDLDPFDELDRLTRVVQTQVDRSDLEGACVPGLTRIKGGRYQASDRYPEWSVDLDGEFTTLVDPVSG